MDHLGGVARCRNRSVCGVDFAGSVELDLASGSSNDGGICSGEFSGTSLLLKIFGEKGSIWGRH